MKLALLNLVALIGSTAYANEVETRPALRGDAANVNSHNTLPEGYLKKNNLGSFKTDRPDEQEHDESQSYHGDEKLRDPDTIPVGSYKLKNNKIKNKISSGGSEDLRETILENFEKTATDQDAEEAYEKKVTLTATDQDAEEAYEKKVTLNNRDPLCAKMRQRCLNRNQPETTCTTVYAFCMQEIASDKFTFQDTGFCRDRSGQIYPQVRYYRKNLYDDGCKALCWSIDGVYGTVQGLVIGTPNTNYAGNCYCLLDSKLTYTCPPGSTCRSKDNNGNIVSGNGPTGPTNKENKGLYTCYSRTSTTQH
mmetsp:Transcript_13251/g.28128  ORF Transcript_13251/g.28128 Transcript_13251/m.28128 type:complete len:307 (-) Transcript_13251:59-979(-)